MNPAFSRKFFVVFAMGAALSLPLSASAQSREPELSFYPAKGWAAGKEGGACSIASSYNNGFDMRFGGAEGRLKSVDIDFHQDIFKQGKSYDSTLAVAGGDAQKIKAVNVAPGVLSFDVSNREALDKALGSASALDVSVEKNSFRFYLSGLEKAYPLFENCLGRNKISSEASAQVDLSSREPKAVKFQEGKPEGAKPERPELDPNFIESAETEKAEAEKLAILRDGAAGAKAPDAEAESVAEPEAAKEPKKKAAAPAPVLSSASSSTQAMVSPAPGLVNKNRLSPEQVSRLVAQQLDGGAVAVAPPASPQPLTPQDLEQKNPASGTELMSATSVAPPPVETLPVEEPIVEKSAADKQPAPEKIVTEKPVVEKPAPQKSEISTPDVRVHRSAAKAEIDFTGGPEAVGASSKELLALRKAADSLRAENAALNEELKSMVRDSEKERLSITSDNWNLEQATMKFNEAERQTKRLGMELQKERARCDNERKDLEAMLFDPQLTNQQQLARLGDLEEQLAKAKEESQLQREHYEERIRALEAASGKIAP